jgi:hypothetical protein
MARWNIEAKVWALAEQAEAAGVELLLNAYVVASIVEEDAVRGGPHVGGRSRFSRRSSSTPPAPAPWLLCRGASGQERTERIGLGPVAEARGRRSDSGSLDGADQPGCRVAGGDPDRSLKGSDLTLGNQMSSRERVLTALRCEVPDRVPFLEAWVGERIGLALLGRTLLEGTPKREQKDGDLRADSMPVHTEPVDAGPVYTGTRPTHSPTYEPIELVQALQLDGIGASLSLQGVRQDESGHYVVAGQRVRARADLARVQLPDPDDPALYEPFRSFIAQYRDTGLALFCRVSPGASALIFGLGLERFALALYDDRPLIEDLLSLYSDWTARAMRNLCALDFDFIWSGEDIAHKTGPFVSPRMFRELFVPNYRRVAEGITKPWIWHSDGNLLPILDDLVDLGLNAIHPVEPKVMDLAELKRRYGRRLCFCGRIEVETLSQGTPQQIERLVREAIQIAAPGGGYIAGSSNSITEYCRPENVRAMQNAIMAYGRYPIRVENGS